MIKSDSKILGVIAERRSEVSFLPLILDDEVIETLIDAARWAPSAFNEQPWRFYLGNRKNPDSFQKILSTLAPGNQEWAKNASLLILTVTNKILSRNGKENYHAMHDLGMASFSLAMQAQAMGLVTHFMGGFDHVIARENLRISNDFLLGSVIAVGKKGSNENLPDSLHQRISSPRKRLSISDIIVEL